MKFRLILLMALTIAITRLWELFYNGYEPIVIFWDKLGLDLTKKYDWFLFFDFADRGGQYVHWYAQYTNYLLSISILSYIIYDVLKDNHVKAIAIASKVMLFFSIFRLISYWLFRGSIQFEILCTSLICFLILIIQKWRQ